MASFNYFGTPVGPEYTKKFARNVGIALLILFSFYGVWTYLKVFLDQCGVPQEFQFKCFDSEGEPLVSLNSKNDDVLEHLQNQNCLEMER